MTTEQVPYTMLTVEQAAARWQVHQRVIQEMIDAGALPYCILGGNLIRIPVQDFDDYGTRLTIKPWSVKTTATDPPEEPIALPNPNPTPDEAA